MSENTTELVEESAVETPPMAEEGEYHYDARFLSRVLEGAMLAAGEALSLNRMLTLFDEDKRPSKALLLSTLEHIQENSHDRGFILKEVASGWRFEVCDDLAPWVNRLWEEKPQRYSRALLETLALIAYRQPLTRGDIEDVRGVAVSSHIIRTLTEREWVKVVGHRDVPGRPALYATTRQFLDYFGLNSLEQLPSLGELKDIETLSKELSLATEDSQAQTEESKPSAGDADEKMETSESETPAAEQDESTLETQAELETSVEQNAEQASNSPEPLTDQDDNHEEDFSADDSTERQLD